MPGIVDHALALLIAVIIPVYGAITWKSFQREVAKGRSGARVGAYREALIIEWSLCMGLVVLWSVTLRAPADLGLTVAWNIPTIASLAIVLVICCFFAWQWFSVLRLRGDIPDSLKSQFDSVAEMIPITTQERKLFILVSCTAGICEELLFRGFLIWYLRIYAGLAGAVALSVLIFGLGHFYQGKEGILKTTLAGLFVTSIYLWSGSLLAPIILHTVMDLAGGLTGSEVLRPARASMKSPE